MAAPFTFDRAFCLPVDFNPSATPKIDESICVISIYGKSRYNPFVSKATLLNPIIDKEVFQGPEGLFQNQVKQGNVECYFDESSRIMYLHLKSYYDLNILSQKCHDLGASQHPNDFYSLCQEEDVKHAKTLLLLFTLSHIMILFHPGGTFDLSYLRLFHSLDAVRGKLQTSMCEILSSISGVSSKWSSFGRVCTPRVLFVFETPSLEGDEAESSSFKSSKKYPPMKRLQMGIEDMIYRILRKTRAITNISNNSLFSIPVNHQFVYLHSKRQEISDPAEFMTSLIRHQCSPLSEAVVTDPTPGTSGSQQKSKSYSLSRRKMNPPVPEPLSLSATSTLSTAKLGAASQQALSTPSKSFSGGRQPGLSKSNDQSLKEFLRQHVDMVFSKSINDNVGRHGVEPIFELPQLGTWLQVANKMYDFFFSETYSNVTAQPFSLFRNSLDISTRFSENRCNKVLPLAETAYQQDLPQYYITSYHESRLNKAKHVFSQYARGPGYDKYMRELELSCTKFWKSGRQQCEALSLTGNLCTNKVHRLPGEEPDGPDDLREEMKHCSMVKTKAACNCGRMQSDKEDPFDFKSANYDFYQDLGLICCSKLEHIPLPVFTPSTPEPKAASVPSVSLTPQDGQEAESAGQQKASSMKEPDKPDVFGTLSELSLALSLGQSTLQADDLEPKLSPSGSNKGSQREAIDVANEKQLEPSLELKQGEVKNKPIRQVSTSEYLAYMIHSRSPPGLLPKFSSFSVCRLGPNSLYSHMMGLELPGFLPGSNFLLPWDILVKSEQAWPSVAETFTSGKKRQQRKISKGGPEPGDTATTVRVYLGMEYECPRGHRFFCSGPDKIIKVSSNSIVKDNASRLVHMDMPLYTSCHCKQPKGCLAQMMRVYVCTPRDISSVPSLRVLVNPLVQPAPPNPSHPAGTAVSSSSSPGCPQFHPGLDAPLELPADGIWVIRLPSIYQDEHQVYLMPSDHQTLHSCVLLSGMFSYRMV
ncbi:protein smg8-like [Elysia marginata]|uniref:Nonsense-mediated mRNA decay factor SMG8 n=1 Tax=Elysia marginata TaxID=1093978 RepID=A0AAV4I4X3_9GAST|nr:protein smg8-like [Elysia marginata]